MLNPQNQALDADQNLQYRARSRVPFRSAPRVEQAQTDCPIPVQVRTETHSPPPRRQQLNPGRTLWVRIRHVNIEREQPVGVRRVARRAGDHRAHVLRTLVVVPQPYRRCAAGQLIGILVFHSVEFRQEFSKAAYVRRRPDRRGSAGGGTSASASTVPSSGAASGDDIPTLRCGGKVRCVVYSLSRLASRELIQHVLLPGICHEFDVHLGYGRCILCDIIVAPPFRCPAGQRLLPLLLRVFTPFLGGLSR
mmetsp:Transcript_7147/g.17767  ORF Transcript_7147/g.17767 Transcript_7147/m.17767 type:complete len:250 (-) Transcript_7147:763-1512(-)